MTTALNAITFKSQTHPRHRFQNLYGLLGRELLYKSWEQLNKRAKAGIDGVTAPIYELTLVENLERLNIALKTKRYRANDIKRVFILKSNGKLRPLGLPTVDDKLVPQSVSQLLQSIWETDFLPNSYGYRPYKSAHQAVHSLTLNLQFKRYGYIVEADIKGFFDNIDHEWMLKMLKQRIDDEALLSLIKQWLKARIRTPEGEHNKPKNGTPQGGIISPVLANIYLHYALDLWFEKKVKPGLSGKAMLIRYADDFVCAFEHGEDAKCFYEVLPKRLSQFKLDIAADKTSLIRFSRHYPSRKRQFVFLGFAFYWGVDVKGKARLRRRTASEKQRSTLRNFTYYIKKTRSQKLVKWLPQLKRKLVGFVNYFGLPDNSRSVSRLYNYVLHTLFKWLNRRSGRRSYNWHNFKKMLEYFQIRKLRVSKRVIHADWY